jgi:sec-independent protein translocase protein TatA
LPCRRSLRAFDWRAQSCRIDSRFAGLIDPTYELSNIQWAGIRILKLLLALVILLLLFSNRLPSLARSLGQSVTEFKRGFKEIEDQSNNDKSE